MVRSTVRWNSNRNTTLPPLTVSADQIMSGWRRWSVFLLTSPVDSSRSVEKSISVAHSGGVVADQDLGHASVGENRLEEGVVHGISGTVGTPSWGRSVGVCMVGWA